MKIPNLYQLSKNSTVWLILIAIAATSTTVFAASLLPPSTNFTSGKILQSSDLQAIVQNIEELQSKVASISTSGSGLGQISSVGGPIYLDGSKGGNPVGFHSGNDTNSLLVQSHTPVKSGGNYTENFIMLDALHGTQALIPVGQSKDNIPVCLNVTRNNGTFGLFSVDCAGNLQSSGGASFSGTVYVDQQLPICPGPRCWLDPGNPNNGLHIGGTYCPFNGDKPCPGLVQSLAPSNSGQMIMLDSFHQKTGGSNTCLDVTRNNGATSLFRVDCNGNGVAASSISGQSHNNCSVTSGWPCVTSTSCSISSATECWGTATVPAGSLCTVSTDSSDTTVGIVTYRTTVSGTVLTVTATAASVQKSGAVSHATAICN